MKKILLMIVPLMALIGCSYDDTDIQKRLDDLDGQLTELQALVKALKSDVTTLKELVAGKRFISDVQPGEDGGYVITLVTAAGETSTITISDGEDGTSSVIGVKQDSDGVYYWTLNGDFILDNGKKLPVSGVTPEFKIENSHWWVSYDNGATWTDCGQAQTDQNLFKSVATSEDGKLVYLTLADGTRYPLPGCYSYTRRDVSSTAGTIVLVVAFPNPDGRLKPGQFARVEANVGPVLPYVVVPQRCVSQSQNLASVWVVAEDGTVSYRRVTPGPVYGGMWCIAEGLEAGETVAASGLQKLHDGDKVSLPKS